MNALNKFVGPSGENGRYDRWNWLTACLRFCIRLEDCTGQSLGTLPQDDESGDERSDDDCDDDNDRGEWVSGSDEEEPEWERRVSPLPEGNGRAMELTRLLEKCRVMNERRDEMIALIRPK